MIIRGPWARAYDSFRDHRLGIIAFWMLAVILCACFVLPLFLSHGPNTQDLESVAQAPSWNHPCGTDHLGRDLLARILVGGRLSLTIGFLAALVSIVVGAAYGAVAGFFGGRAGEWMMRLVDLFYGLPDLLFVILITTYLGRDVFNLILALSAVSWLTTSRIVKAQVQVIREADYVAAARLAGCSTPRLIASHVLPQIMGPLVAYTTLVVPGVMLSEAFLSFLGLGVEPPNASWGSLIHEGAQGMEVFPWMLVFPVALFSLTLLALNLFGDGLRDALDPRANTSQGLKKKVEQPSAGMPS